MRDQAATVEPTRQETGTFVYAVVPGDVEATAQARGLHDRAVEVVTHGDLAALVSEVPVDRPLGQPEDLLAYERLLDETAPVAPVLPVRFGTVLAGPDAVVDLLAARHDNLRAALESLEGRAQYTVRARYVQRAVLTEVLDENPEVAQLREQLRGQPEEATVNLRIRLGEIVNQAVEAKRAADTQRVVHTLGPLAVQTVVRPATHEEDAANVAFLVDTARQDEFATALDGLASEWADRAEVRLLGPLAPYDFVGPAQDGG